MFLLSLPRWRRLRRKPTAFRSALQDHFACPNWDFKTAFPRRHALIHLIGRMIVEGNDGYFPAILADTTLADSRDPVIFASLFILNNQAVDLLS